MRMTPPRAVAAALLAACLAGGPARAQAQSDCPAPADLQPRQLVGLWHAEFDGLAQGATLLLEPHPRHAGSLSGEVDRNGLRSRLAADLDDGELTLEESTDGVHISATWLGEVVDGSCGREIRGSWQAAGAQPAHAFVLRRRPDAAR